MLEDNPDWAGKVRVLGLSFDDSKEEAKERIE